MSTRRTRYRSCLVLVSAAAVAIHPSVVWSQCEVAKLTASDAGPGDRLGLGTALCGQLAVVGAHYYDLPGSTDTGAAYVFRSDGSVWTEEAILTVPKPSDDDFFGITVDCQKNRVVVGSVGEDHNTGAAYVYRFDGSDWILESRLSAPDGTSFDRFGIDVAIDGDAIVVGEWSDSEAAPDAGAAYVYRLEKGRWNLEAKLTASDAQEDAHLGISTALQNDVLVAGAFRDGNEGDGPGAAYIFRFDGNRWTEEAKLSPPTTEPGAHFGFSVSISGNAILVGSTNATGATPDSGAAYLFRYDGAGWPLEAVLIASDGKDGDNFGYAASLSGDVALVSAYGDDDLGAVSGSAYIYRYDGASWIEQGKLNASDGAPVDLFGYSLALDGDQALVGAIWNDDAGSTSGSAYVFAGLVGVDCNGNTEPDACDIFNGTSDDANGNGVPDECEPLLDIEPGDCPNEFKPRLGNNGHKIDIALVGTEDFDVMDVDFSTILLSRADGVGGAVLPERVRVKDRATPFDGEPCDCHGRKKDGIPDLRMRFFAVEMTFEMELDLLAEGESVELMVTGELLDGTPFAASDCIVIDDPPGRDDDSDSDDDSSDDDSDS